MATDQEIEEFLNELDPETRKFIQSISDFFDYFTNCIICEKKLDGQYLENFFFSRDSEKEVLREKLLSLIKETKREDSIFNSRKQIYFGIACCHCFYRQL